MKKKKTESKNSNMEFDINDYYVFSYELSEDVRDKANKRIIDFLPSFEPDTPVSLQDLEKFLVGKYKAEQADWKDIDACTRMKIKRCNKYCQTVLCVSEGQVTDEDYYSAYIIKRENLINPPPLNKDDFFYDLFIIVGSEDKEHLTSYYIGGCSEGFGEEIYVMCGKK